MTDYNAFKGKYKELGINTRDFINLTNPNNIESLKVDYNKRRDIVSDEMELMDKIEGNIDTPPVTFRGALHYICGDVLKMLENYDKAPSMFNSLPSISSTPSYSGKINKRLFPFSVQNFEIINKLLDEINEELKQKIQSIKPTVNPIINNTNKSNPKNQSGGKGKRMRKNTRKGKGKRRRTKNKKF